MVPVLVVVGGGRAEYKRYLLERIARHYALVLLSPQAPTWELPYIVDHAVIDPADDGSVLAAVTALAERYRVIGVLTHQEPCVGVVARAAEALGLPGCGVRAAQRCRDKYAARRAFEAAGVASARYRVVHGPAEAVRAAEEIGYPVVVKPRGLTASFGVRVVRGPGQLAEAVERASANAFAEGWRFEHGVLVEEYLDGPEISVDSVVRGGEVLPVVFARKLLGPEPYFDEFGHIVAPLPLLTDRPGSVLSVVRAAHAALGVHDSMTHTEIRLTAAGPRVVELNGRLGGDLIPLVAEHAGGVDLATVSAHVAAGRPVELPRPSDGVAGIRFFYPEAAGGEPTAIPTGDPPSWVLQLTPLVEPGTEVAAVPGRYYYARTGYAIVEGATPQECAARMGALTAPAVP